MIRRCTIRRYAELSGYTADAYQARHTYATLCLMAGANPAWIARQLGHANLGMLLTHYARWIDRADGGAEIGKIESAIGNAS